MSLSSFKDRSPPRVEYKQFNNLKLQKQFKNLTLRKQKSSPKIDFKTEKQNPKIANLTITSLKPLTATAMDFMPNSDVDKSPGSGKLSKKHIKLEKQIKLTKTSVERYNHDIRNRSAAKNIAQDQITILNDSSYIYKSNFSK